MLPVLCKIQAHKHTPHELIVHHMLKFSFRPWIHVSPTVSYLCCIFYNRAAHACKILIDQPWFEAVLFRFSLELSIRQIKDRAGKYSGSGTKCWNLHLFWSVQMWFLQCSQWLRLTLNPKNPWLLVCFQGLNPFLSWVSFVPPYASREFNDISAAVLFFLKQSFTSLMDYWYFCTFFLKY